MPRFEKARGSMSLAQFKKMIGNTNIKGTGRVILLKYLVDGIPYNRTCRERGVSRQFGYKKLISIEARLMRQGVL